MNIVLILHFLVNNYSIYIDVLHFLLYCTVTVTGLQGRALMSTSLGGALVPFVVVLVVGGCLESVWSLRASRLASDSRPSCFIFETLQQISLLSLFR